VNKHQPKTSKVVPFTGEFYPEIETSPSPSPVAGATFIFVAAALVGGLALGAIAKRCCEAQIATYQSADQTQLRQLQTDQLQLQQVKSKVCKD